MQALFYLYTETTCTIYKPPLTRNQTLLNNIIKHD